MPAKLAVSCIMLTIFSTEEVGFFGAGPPPVISAVEMEFNEENQKKVPRARKANFSMLEESILQREVENNFDVLRDKHSNSVFTYLFVHL
jgi:hypothetical protein